MSRKSAAGKSYVAASAINVEAMGLTANGIVPLEKYFLLAECLRLGATATGEMIAPHVFGRLSLYQDPSPGVHHSEGEGEESLGSSGSSARGERKETTNQVVQLVGDSSAGEWKQSGLVFGREEFKEYQENRNAMYRYFHETHGVKFTNLVTVPDDESVLDLRGKTVAIQDCDGNVVNMVHALMQCGAIKASQSLYNNLLLNYKCLEKLKVKHRKHISERGKQLRVLKKNYQKLYDLDLDDVEIIEMIKGDIKKQELSLEAEFNNITRCENAIQQAKKAAMRALSQLKKGQKSPAKIIWVGDNFADRGVECGDELTAGLYSKLENLQIKFSETTSDHTQQLLAELNIHSRYTIPPLNMLAKNDEVKSAKQNSAEEKLRHDKLFKGDDEEKGTSYFQWDSYNGLFYIRGTVPANMPQFQSRLSFLRQKSAVVECFWARQWIEEIQRTKVVDLHDSQKLEMERRLLIICTNWHDRLVAQFHNEKNDGQKKILQTRLVVCDAIIRENGDVTKAKIVDPKTKHSAKISLEVVLSGFDEQLNDDKKVYEKTKQNLQKQILPHIRLLDYSMPEAGKIRIHSHVPLPKMKQLLVHLGEFLCEDSNELEEYRVRQANVYYMARLIDKLNTAYKQKLEGGAGWMLKKMNQAKQLKEDVFKKHFQAHAKAVSKDKAHYSFDAFNDLCEYLADKDADTQRQLKGAYLLEMMHWNRYILPEEQSTIENMVGHCGNKWKVVGGESTSAPLWEQKQSEMQPGKYTVLDWVGKPRLVNRIVEFYEAREKLKGHLKEYISVEAAKKIQSLFRRRLDQSKLAGGKENTGSNIQGVTRHQSTRDVELDDTPLLEKIKGQWGKMMKHRNCFAGEGVNILLNMAPLAEVAVTNRRSSDIRDEAKQQSSADYHYDSKLNGLIVGAGLLNDLKIPSLAPYDEGSAEEARKKTFMIQSACLDDCSSEYLNRKSKLFRNRIVLLEAMTPYAQIAIKKKNKKQNLCETTFRAFDVVEALFDYRYSKKSNQQTLLNKINEEYTQLSKATSAGEEQKLQQQADPTSLRFMQALKAAVLSPGNIYGTVGRKSAVTWARNNKLWDDVKLFEDELKGQYKKLCKKYDIDCSIVLTAESKQQQERRSIFTQPLSDTDNPSGEEKMRAAKKKVV